MMVGEADLGQLIAEAESRRCRAMVEVDVRALHGLLHDDLVWIHASGRVDGKPALITTLERDRPYRQLTISDHTVRPLSDVCISSGKIAVTLATTPLAEPYSNLFTNIWAIDDGRWRLVHGQSTRCASG